MNQVTTGDVDRVYDEVIKGLDTYVKLVKACDAVARASWNPEEKFVAPGAELLTAFDELREEVLGHCRIAGAALGLVAKKEELQVAGSDVLPARAEPRRLDSFAREMREVLHEASRGRVTVRSSSAPSWAEAVVWSLRTELALGGLDLGQPSEKTAAWLGGHTTQEVENVEAMCAEVNVERSRVKTRLRASARVELRDEQGLWHFEAGELRLDGRLVELTRQSRRLMRLLIEFGPGGITHEQLNEKEWGKDEVDDRLIRQGMSALRGALRDLGLADLAERIKATGEGYRLVQA